MTDTIKLGPHQGYLVRCDNEQVKLYIDRRALEEGYIVLLQSLTKLELIRPKPGG